MAKRALILFILLGLALIVAAGWGGTETLILATTTSTADSGLLDYILPPFEEAYHCRVEVIAVGTGQAIKLGRRGDCDVILVHARAEEDEFVAQGYGVSRRDIMYNDFVIIGPPDDRAVISEAASAAEAFARIAKAEATFVSRGDNSGTHLKEMEIWEEAGLTPTPGEDKWYLSVGQGMGETLTFANEKLAYTISDRATYLSRSGGLDLVILFEGDEILLNPYGIIAVNPELHPHVNYDLAMAFIEYITSYDTQLMIAQFGVEEYGQPLFYPNSLEFWQNQ